MDGFRDLRHNWDDKWALLSVNVERGDMALLADPKSRDWTQESRKGCPELDTRHP
jgi:hypothetical protein